MQKLIDNAKARVKLIERRIDQIEQQIEQLKQELTQMVAAKAQELEAIDEAETKEK